ncbi:hypothetical protein EVJ58_g7201 [Rhodofomes roseus]|uniref:HTH CENPB-type domain-containing protein n=1 Tax=Rhodofomes roseus TaxID=34475 RepID=A0A4Y9Y6U4_9APHY|nr:hypothetical protein EVJ58_g7201 [Rhodofomes roseus]
MSAFESDTPSFDPRMLTWQQLMKIRRAEAKQRRPPGEPILTRRPFYAADKKAVCELYVANPGITHQQIADQFGVHKSMVTRVLATQDQWLKSQHSPGSRFARPRAIRFREVDFRMEPWIARCRYVGLQLTDKMIKKQAILIAEDEGLRGEDPDRYFHCGRTWLRRFKERFGILDGVPTRVGYSPTDLARERAFGNYPLDIFADRSLDELAEMLSPSGDVQVPDGYSLYTRPTLPSPATSSDSQRSFDDPSPLHNPSQSPSRPSSSPAYSSATPGSLTHPEATAHNPLAGQPFHAPYARGGYQESFLRGSKG